MRDMNSIWGGLAAAFVVRAFGAIVAIFIALEVGDLLTRTMAEVEAATSVLGAAR